MTKHIKYKSVLAPYMDIMLNIRQSFGYSAKQIKYILKEFDDFAVGWNLQTPHIDEELIKGWRKSRKNDNETTIYRKFCVWKELAILMGRHGCKCDIPRLPRNMPSSFTPYIYNKEEMKKIFEESDKLRNDKNYINAALMAIPIILRLLYSTGMRVLEATTLKNEDIFLDQYYIHLRKTKNGHERLVPLGDDMVVELRRYEMFRNRIPVNHIAAPGNPYFIKLDGLPIKSDSVRLYFRAILDKCDIKFVGDKKGPRIHDLRHTFAVHTMLQMVNQGMDLYTCLPVLSAALGHRTLRSTEKYVRLTQAMYPEVAQKSTGIDAFIYNVILD